MPTPVIQLVKMMTKSSVAKYPKTTWVKHPADFIIPMSFLLSDMLIEVKKYTIEVPVTIESKITTLVKSENIWVHQISNLPSIAD